MSFQLLEERYPRSRSIQFLSVFGAQLQTSKPQHPRCLCPTAGDLGKDFKQELKSSPI